MIIETERFILRPFCDSDAEDILEYLREPAVNRFTCMKLNSLDEAKAEIISFVNNSDGTPLYENTMQYAILKKEWHR